MFRYICPFILVGGKSERFGEKKSAVLFNDFSFLDFRLNFLFNIGFVDVFLNGIFMGYSFFKDESHMNGPLSAFLTSFFKKNIKFSHFLFVSVDNTFFDIRGFFLMFTRCRNFYSYFFLVSTLPLLLSVSFNIFFVLLSNYFFKKNFFLCVYFFIKLILLDFLFFCFFVKKNFFDINTRYNLILYHRFY